MWGSVGHLTPSGLCHRPNAGPAPRTPGACAGLYCLPPAGAQELEVLSSPRAAPPSRPCVTVWGVGGLLTPSTRCVALRRDPAPSARSAPFLCKGVCEALAARLPRVSRSRALEAGRPPPHTLLSPAEVMHNFPRRPEVQLEVMNKLLTMPDDQLGRDPSAPLAQLLWGSQAPIPPSPAVSLTPLGLVSVPTRAVPVRPAWMRRAAVLSPPPPSAGVRGPGSKPSPAASLQPSFVAATEDTTASHVPPGGTRAPCSPRAVSYTHLRAHET